ncbi:hypothetical protein LAZ67_7000853 [Cordylochernes scorpioides]|uniref:Uncharacterized protein n=1 Tax=Cordylochernes scorpioides TaxID=51811 RepID=A0ABY6KM67_9ARAC|nr:hypothetical protein LAZ67_7000853 [Cordylochernes scorpioides]
MTYKAIRRTIGKNDLERLHLGSLTPPAILSRHLSIGLSPLPNREEVENWLDEWIASKPKTFFYDDIYKIPNLWKNIIISIESYEPIIPMTTTHTKQHYETSFFRSGKWVNNRRGDKAKTGREDVSDDDKVNTRGKGHDNHDGELRLCRSQAQMKKEEEEQ